MKSERRHQMQQNELADAMGHGLQHLMPYARAIVFGIVGLCICIFAYSFATSRNRAYESNASLDFLLATNNEDPESFQRITQDYADTAAGKWAQQAQADHNLAAGIDAMFIDRDEAATFLAAATDNYQEIIDSAKDPLLKSRAHLGLAKAYEAQGEIEKAVNAYEMVAKNTESKVMAEHATDRIALLKSAEMESFYTWFRENQPKAPEIKSPVLPGMQTIPDAPESAQLPKIDIGGEMAIVEEETEQAKPDDGADNKTQSDGPTGLNPPAGGDASDEADADK